MTEQANTFAKVYLDPQNLPFGEVMSNGKSYRVPRFQRDYSWEHDQWNELWEDIERMLQYQEQHFMGYLVFQANAADKNFLIIDGQQRLTTLTIVILAAIARLNALIADGVEKDENTRRVEIYRNTYVQVRDPVNLGATPKLILNRHNDRHFGALTNECAVTIQRNITKTNRCINKAFEFFAAKFEAHTTGKSVAEILQAIADGLLFTTITVKDDLDAYTVFETLNARGMHLSTPDLLKNYLLSILAHGTVPDQSFDDFEEQWQSVLEQLGETEFTNFLRSHEGMSRKLPSKKGLFNVLKKSIKQSQQVFPYLADLAKNAPVYAALQDHNDNFWNEHDGRYTAAREHLEALRVFNVKTPLSLLMAGFQKLSAADFVKLLRYITVVAIRYNAICDKPAKSQEVIYNRMANQLMQGEKPLADLVNSLKQVYPADEEFVIAFKSKVMLSRRTNKKVSYLLRKIEKQLSGEDLSVSLTLEHVLPFAPNDEWQEYFGRSNYADAIDRLGNIALLSSSQNMAQESFDEKRAILAASSHKINQHIAEYAEWNMDSLEEHQAWLAKQAKSVWQISQFND